MFLLRLLVSYSLLSKLAWAGAGASSGSHLSHSALLSSVNHMIQSLRICLFEFSSPLTVLCESSVGVAVGSAHTCQTTRVIAGKTHSQSPILKTKGDSATW